MQILRQIQARVITLIRKCVRCSQMAWSKRNIVVWPCESTDTPSPFRRWRHHPAHTNILNCGLVVTNDLSSICCGFPYVQCHQMLLQFTFKHLTRNYLNATRMQKLKEKDYVHFVKLYSFLTLYMHLISWISKIRLVEIFRHIINNNIIIIENKNNTHTSSGDRITNESKKWKACSWNGEHFCKENRHSFHCWCWNLFRFLL